MTSTASALAPYSPSGTGGADLEDSNVSSPLSDVDDKDANDEEIEHMQLDHDDGDNSSVSDDDNRPLRNEDSASESALSDARSDVHTDDGNDTEAETERLFDTPKNQRQRDVIVDQFNEGQVFEHTPSKLRRTTALDEDDNNGDVESLSADDASIASSPGETDDSPIKPATTQDTSVDEEVKRDSQERKRKRSLAADQSDSEQPLRKRTASEPAPEEEADHENTAIDEGTPAVSLRRERRSEGEDEDSPAAPDTPADDEAPESETRITKKITRNGSKRKSAAVTAVTTVATTDEPAESTNEDSHADQTDAAAEEETEHPDEEGDGEVDEEADAAARNIEEIEKKLAAYRDWTQIEEMFGIFRHRLYKDRLQRLEEEEQSLLADVPSHPEYLNMKQCLDDRLQRKTTEVNTEYDFRIQALERRAVAQRAQIWSQFFQAVREKREGALGTLNREWYDVQSARRSAHSLPDYGLLFPKDPTQRIRNVVAYNTEVSTLAGIAKYEGFPAGPEMKGASATELEADLNAMERVRRNRQRQVPLREDHQTTAFVRLGPAGEQFLKDTPWANPNHSAHKLQQPTAGSADGRATMHQPNATQVDVKAGVEEAAPAVRKSPALSSGPMESPELARSMLNPTTHQMKRVGSMPSIARGSKAAAV